MKSFIIEKTQAGQRLDKYLKRILPDAQTSLLYKSLRKKNITLNNKKAEGKELLKEGDEVKENEPIAVLEAMKMETNVLATASGKIAKINAKEGSQVVAGELIAVIE